MWRLADLEIDRCPLKLSSSVLGTAQNTHQAIWGWYNTLFLLVKTKYSLAVNCSPLFVTKCSGMLCSANNSLNIFKTLVCITIWTSGHFELVSITIKNMVSWNGPKKLMCTCCQFSMPQSGMECRLVPRLSFSFLGEGGEKESQVSTVCACSKITQILGNCIPL